MLPFRDLLLTDQEAVDWAFQVQNCRLCDYAFAELYIWRHHYHPQICFFDGFLLIWMQTFPGGKQFCYPPVGEGDFNAAVEALLTDASDRNLPFHMSIIPEEMLTRLQSAFPGRFQYSDNPDWYDYLYLSEKLASLSGSALQPKRNQINRFLRTFEGRWVYEPIAPANFQEVVACNQLWKRVNGENANQAIVDETHALLTALDHFERLRMVGGILRLDGSVIAFTFGFRIAGDTMVVPVEKADHRVPGAFQMINKLFVEHACRDVIYVNREDDLGLEGLRKDKHSYHPEMLCKKFQALPTDAEA